MLRRKNIFALVALGVALGAALATSVSCKPKHVEEEAPREVSTAGALAEFGIDAGELGEPLDPPAPAGDLRAEIDAFGGIEHCVAERSKLDPVVADALSSIGYDTFVRDACRVLDALSARDARRCDGIDSTPLRRRCQADVAIVRTDPEACPMQFERSVTYGRDPTCVAVAARDVRLCAAEARVDARATCEAWVLRDAAKCVGLAPSHRARCTRQVARWRSLSEPPLEGLTALPKVQATLEVRGGDKTPDPSVTNVDLAAEFARGVVVVTEAGDRGRARVEIGSLGESDRVNIAASPIKRPRVGLSLVSDEVGSKWRGRDGGAPLATLERLELELPSEAPWVVPPVSCECTVSRATVPTRRGEAVTAAVSGLLRRGEKSYRVTFDVATYVRDVVVDREDRRVLSPRHPSLEPSRLDPAGVKPR